MIVAFCQEWYPDAMIAYVLFGLTNDYYAYNIGILGGAKASYSMPQKAKNLLGHMAISWKLLNGFQR